MLKSKSTYKHKLSNMGVKHSKKIMEIDLHCSIVFEEQLHFTELGSTME